MPERTLVAAATNLMTRGFLTVPTDRRSPAGEPVNGLYAVARAILRAADFKLPARAVAVVAAGAPPAGWPPLLAAQQPGLRALLAALGLTVVESDDEANLVAAYTRAALARGDDVIIAGADKRYAQLVGERVWWYDAAKDTRYTAEIVGKRFGVSPSQVAEWLALVGDDDALPGVTGIGVKGATALLEEHGTVAAALASAVKGRLGNALRAAAGSIPVELARAKLDRELPLPVSLDDAAYTPPAPAALNARLAALGFVELLVATEDGEARVPVIVDPAQLALTGTPALLPVLEDDETLVGVAFASEPGSGYVPRDGAAWPALAGWLADERAPKLVHDLVTAEVGLVRAGVRLAGVVGDSACASHLTEPSNWAPHNLPVSAKHALGRALPDEDALRGVGQKRKLWRGLPAERVAAWAGAGAIAARELWRTLSPKVDPGLIAEYLQLSHTCVRMEQVGITVDLGELERAEQAFVGLEDELTGRIEAHAGHPFNINSTKQLGAVLFEELKLPVAGHTKTGWSVAGEALEKIEHAHPIVPLVIRWRLLRRLREAWVVALRRAVTPDGRVHARFHPARSFSGHLVITNPDLGRVPGRTPEMAMIRRAFVAPPGRVLMSVDFNQLGLYVLAHLTKDPALVEPLARRDDIHLLTASAVLDKPVAAITTDERQLGKVVNFATFAGQGASAPALQLGVPAAEAKEIIARFDRRYAKVREFQDEQLRLARERGYIVTIAGRHWPIGGLESLDPMDRSYAERLARRATHEGSVADVARRALLDADRALPRAGLAATPVHEIIDEVLFEVPEGEVEEAARVAAEAMRNAFRLEVPLVVGVEAGRSWADMEPVASHVL